jgi:hypothetical protein
LQIDEKLLIYRNFTIIFKTAEQLQEKALVLFTFYKGSYGTI